MNIFVAKLNFKTRKEDLEKAFSQFGQVSSAKVVTDRDTGRSKGFGFVEMPNDAEAKKAIAELHQAELEGRSITVNEARPQEQRSGGGGGGYRGGGGGGGYRGGGGGGGGYRGGGGGGRY